MTTKQLKLLLLCWVGLLSHTAANAQKTKDVERRYRSGIRLVQLGDYEQARAELLPVMQRGGSYAPFAYYYHADASYRQKRYEATRATLKELIDRFPNWLKKEEGYYLAAAAAYEQGLYDEGLSYTQLITDPDLRTDVDRMEQTFLPRIGDLNRLKGLQKQYPQNKTLARTLVDLIQRTSSDKDDLELSDRLSNRYGITPTPVTKAPVARPAEPNVPASQPVIPVRTDRGKAKGYVNVGVLFPFRVNRFNTTERARTNQYVYDLYEGMKLAKAKLMSEGITINLFAYDIDNDTDQTLEILNNSSFAQNDLLIGPLYTEPNRLVAAFATQNDIPLVNPIATNHELIANQPNAYLAQPSTLQQAGETALFARELTTNRKAAIYFGASRKDSLFAASYQAALKAQGFQVIDFRRLSGKSASMATAIRLTEENSPGHVFLASSNNDDGPSLLEALSKRGVSSPLIATYPAFDYFRNSLSTFTRRELYLVAPEFMDMEREATEQFQETYLSKRNIIPSTFSAQGYDMLLFFGRQLAKGTIKSKSLQKTDDSEDYVLSGFDYTKSNDNQVVPIIKFDGSRFVKIN
ncbi:ABC transporter substrate-binding protein [uncultured Fibrella sp.]|uniref:ABC transporter substrate-binding protein n=1 Tax=uncultured Fibrella sp. TaxID=1284596 RepID=UPI0035C9F466